MILDARPAAERMLNPTPLDHLYEIQAQMHAIIGDSDPEVQQAVDDHLFTLLSLVDEDDRDHAFESIAQVAKSVVIEEQGRKAELVDQFMSLLEERLA